MRVIPTPSSLPLLITTLVFLSVTTAAVSLPSEVYSHAGVLHLERMFPLNSTSVAVEELRARDRYRHAGLFNGVANFSVYGSADPNVFGIYFTKVKLGTPPKEFSVQIDTGSDLLWVNSNACANCPRSSRFGIELNSYDAAASSTPKQVPCSSTFCAVYNGTRPNQCSKTEQCGYTIEYGDGSGTSGVYLTDEIYLDSTSSAPILFGVSTSRFGILAATDYTVDGILGFGPGELSVFSQLSWRGLIPRVFSHCLKGEGAGGGIFVLGEIVEPGITYTPLVPTRSHFSLYLQSISVNQRTIPVDPAAFKPSTNRGTLVDTGTTFSFIVEEAYGPFLSAVNSVVSPSVRPVIIRGRHCYQISSGVARVFPPVSFEFAGGASLVLKPGEYLVPDSDGSGAWCIGFENGQGLTILGDLVLKDKIFVYDLVRQRIGWTSYNCSAAANVSVPARPSSSSTLARGMILELLPLVMAALFLYASSLNMLFVPPPSLIIA